jgi:hypothetical protein
MMTLKRVTPVVNVQPDKEVRSINTQTELLSMSNVEYDEYLRSARLTPPNSPLQSLPDLDDFFSWEHVQGPLSEVKMIIDEAEYQKLVKSFGREKKLEEEEKKATIKQGEENARKQIETARETPSRQLLMKKRKPMQKLP